MTRTHTPIQMKHFTIAEITPSGVAYAIIMAKGDSMGERVFINQSIMNSLNGAQVGDELLVAVNPNNRNGDIEWFAVMANFADDEG